MKMYRRYPSDKCDCLLSLYSQLYLRQTPSALAPSVHLREVTAYRAFTYSKMTEKQGAGTKTSCLSYRDVWLIGSLDTLKLPKNRAQGPTPVVRLTEASVKRELTVVKTIKCCTDIVLFWNEVKRTTTYLSSVLVFEVSGLQLYL